eukprot:scaffold1729_cov117-Cylindrotheca_fusiformis.AAC.1
MSQPDAEKKLIFLDIDGVVLPFPFNESNTPGEGFLFPTCTMDPFKRLLQVTEAKVVLSSTWRTQPSFVEDILADFKKHEIPVTTFFSMTDTNVHSERQWEIQQWLENNPSVGYWLALDDEELIEGEENKKFRPLFEGHVIKTKSSVGLTEADVDQAILLWEAQLASEEQLD